MRKWHLYMQEINFFKQIGQNGAPTKTGSMNALKEDHGHSKKRKLSLRLMAKDLGVVKSCGGQRLG